MNDKAIFELIRDSVEEASNVGLSIQPDTYGVMLEARRYVPAEEKHVDFIGATLLTRAGSQGSILNDFARVCRKPLEWAIGFQNATCRTPYSPHGSAQGEAMGREIRKWWDNLRKYAD